MTPCSMLDADSFWKTWCLHLQGRGNIVAIFSSETLVSTYKSTPYQIFSLAGKSHSFIMNSSAGNRILL